MMRAITEAQAAAILAILREECGYLGVHDSRGFVRAVRYPNEQPCREWRFMGALGFGGKFRNNGNRDNTPYVDCYPEHLTPERAAMIDRANVRIAAVFKEGEG